MGWNTVSNAESWRRVVDAWISHLEDFGRRPWTIVQYRSEARRFAAWAVDQDLQIEDVTRLDVESYVAHMRTTRGPEISESSSRVIVRRRLSGFTGPTCTRLGCSGDIHSSRNVPSKSKMTTRID